MYNRIGEILVGYNEIKSIYKIFNFKLLFLVFILFYRDLIFPFSYSKTKTFEFFIKNQFNDLKITKDINLDYKNLNFAIIQRSSCLICGLFSNYKVFLGCVRKYLIQGFIPILELESYKNVINGFTINPSKGNPWEYYFNQPFGYKYDNVVKKAKNIKYVECVPREYPNESIFLIKQKMNYWHIIANKYIPIKNEIIKESNIIINSIFKKSRNVLGLLLRGTDYISRKPKKHPIPPKTEDVIKDVKLIDKKNKYDWIFLATEDDNIRQKIIRSIGSKVKCLLNKSKIFYNYSSKKFLAFNVNFKKNIEFNKIYLLNVIILSKCLDFLGAKTNGTIGVFILTNGFRNFKVYSLGHYK